MELITPESPEKDYSDKKIVFLAGPIKGAPDWQARAIEDLKDLDIYVANPRRENVINFNLDMQVDWESKYLAAADVIMFWIPPKDFDVSGRDYAQTSRFELAEWMAKTNYNHTRKQIIVGISDDFYGKSYIVKRLQAQNVVVYNTYFETIKKARELLHRTNKIFFTSDTHFGSQRTLSLSRRPFSCVKEMDSALIDNWNKKVSPEDTVYHLGDFGDVSIRQYLNGKINLILGNYEQDLLQQNTIFKEQLDKIFACCKEDDTLCLKDGTTVFLTHKPSKLRSDLFGLFGHIHGLKKVIVNGFNVGVDANHFIPVSEDDVLFYKNAVLNQYDYEVFL